ncbi:metal-dependent hydrolase [Halosegnis marinus]|uniref:Metal-dependent hydrolase n=1 Tax=Halosegnis marinus TaxID=3034023 RepID=A0ABD5ZNI7_9EURY|nr:metal-dependent hydrolase [Halosegnis sp. DT85]
MMATTHALAGMALAAPVALVAPELAPVAVAAGAAGGVVPDLDLYGDHRRTLHFPVYYPLAAALAAALASVAPGTATVAAAVALAAAGLHSGMDALGGGLELRPWEGTSERAVFDHYRGRWLAPRRWVPYDGAPEDLALAAVLGVPTLAVAPAFEPVVLGLLAVSTAWVLVRKPVARLTERLVRLLPSGLAARLPARFTGGR